MVITEQLLNYELCKLKIQGYNPISGLYHTPDKSTNDIIAEMPILQALIVAHKKLKCAWFKTRLV